MPEVFSNLGSTTVSSGGTTAPAAGTSESWTVASSASFPALAAGQVFHVVEDDPVKQSEIITVTAIVGTTWTVTRGAEGTTPIAHTAAFPVVQVLTRGVLGSFLQSNVVKVSAAYTVLDAANTTVIADATAAGFAVTTSSVVTGGQITVKKTDATANVVTVTAASGLIDGQATFPLSWPYASVTLVPDGTNWNVT